MTETKEKEFFTTEEIKTLPEEHNDLESCWCYKCRKELLKQLVKK